MLLFQGLCAFYVQICLILRDSGWILWVLFSTGFPCQQKLQHLKTINIRENLDAGFPIWQLLMSHALRFPKNFRSWDNNKKSTTKSLWYKYFVCFSESVRFSVFFFFRFQLDTKWTYVDSVDLFFSTSQAQKWTVRWFFVCWHFSFPPFFFETKTSADLRLKTEVSPCVAARTTSSHALTCIQSWGAGFLKKKMIFSVCVVKQGRTNIIMERKATKTQQAMILKRKHIRT